MKTGQSGLTLIELMVALLISALLATMAWQGYQRKLVHSRRAEGRAAVLQVLMQQQQRMARLGSYRAFDAVTTPGGPPREIEFKWHSGARQADAAYLLSARACDKATLQQCVLVTARPGAVPGGLDWSDPQCQALTADSRGGRGAGDSNGNGDRDGAGGPASPGKTDQCW